ncbi:hypothetical protein GP486_004363 [Trichoglossum hirsutum]|uniref:Uncharacterized protein n=1 Tax=Trichoglossum hirsutum TaxID=265104 RepID=A0A9P8LBA8_9PEZI|nr:hypothetical protein GP486_004363 [Trichoglossum hirsutum]
MEDLVGIGKLCSTIVIKSYRNIERRSSNELTTSDLMFTKLKSGGSLKIEADFYGKTILALSGRRVIPIVQIGRSRKQHYAEASVPQPQSSSEFGQAALTVECKWIDESHRMLARIFGNGYANVIALLLSDLYKEFICVLCCNWVTTS